MNKPKPILFNGSMVRANIREVQQPGTGKTQTRRVLKPQPAVPVARIFKVATEIKTGRSVWNAHDTAGAIVAAWPTGDGFCRSTELLLRYNVGDVLWVRESLRIDLNRETLVYCADDHSVSKGSFAWAEWMYAYGRNTVPSIHMPRWASRLTREVTDVRVERLQDISEADAIAEGVCQFCEDNDRKGSWEGLSSDDRLTMVRVMYGSAVRAYSHLWDTINGAGAWDANPWVVAVTYRPHLMNVDAFLAQRVAA